MKAFLRSVRITPKKANLVASMVRGCTVSEALESLKHTNKKAARIIEKVIASALANAEHNEKQKLEDLVIKTIVVNKAQAYNRGVPMARGRVRAIRKFMSHIEVTLGLADGVQPAKETKEPEPKAKKVKETTSQAAPKAAQSTKNKKESEKGTSKVQKAPKDTAASATNSATPKS